MVWCVHTCRTGHDPTTQPVCGWCVQRHAISLCCQHPNSGWSASWLTIMKRVVERATHYDGSIAPLAPESALTIVVRVPDVVEPVCRLWLCLGVVRARTVHIHAGLWTMWGCVRTAPALWVVWWVLLRWWHHTNSFPKICASGYCLEVYYTLVTMIASHHCLYWAICVLQNQYLTSTNSIKDWVVDTIVL